ncbi:MAG: PaeR7I family type II restriction endonuclease [Terracidiphilus sp.]|nr:PaeR7I family type II restriction endonuclease [Terracidiphilus sp.]
MKIDERLQHAIQGYWEARAKNKNKQILAGRSDTGARSEVTGGTQMSALEDLITDIIVGAGITRSDIKTRTALELPGYYRSEKKWDLLVVSENRLVMAMEFKSQVGPSFGNNLNNRSEEAIGSATDIWVAYREGRFGQAPAPFLGYFFLLEDCPRVKTPVRNKEPHFKVDPMFSGASYCKRYEILARRLVLERVYTAACLVMSTRTLPAQVTQPADDLSFHRFIATLRGHVIAFQGSQSAGLLT